MRLCRLIARGYRNLAEVDRETPASGLVLLGANAQGKTNLLEAIYYPVLFRYLDRVLSLSDRRYLRALTSYRAALAQRNSALRLGRVDVAQAFNGALATSGAALVRWRLDWVATAAEQFTAELESLGEQGKA